MFCTSLYHMLSATHHYLQVPVIPQLLCKHLHTATDCLCLIVIDKYGLKPMKIN